jgi:FAD/FMN-containing dehydrogenase
MGAIEAIDRESLQVVAGAGTTLEELQERLEPEKLELPLDLRARSQATLGGMAATNAGGARLPPRHDASPGRGGARRRHGGRAAGWSAEGLHRVDWHSVLVGSEGGRRR